jgi:indolepyruvate ferredoxin oxidoreductase
VHSHAVIARHAEDIHNTRIAMGRADLVLCGDLVVGSSPDAIARMKPGHTRTLLNADVTPTAAFISNPNWSLAGAELKNEIEQACGEGRIETIDASELAVKLLGDAVYANPLMMGFAYQKGWLPLHHTSIERAMTLNAVQIENNIEAFNWGRRIAHEPLVTESLLATGHSVQHPGPHGAEVLELKRPGSEFEQLRDQRAGLLKDYQDTDYAARYLQFVNEVAAAERQACGSTRLAMVVARQAYTLMAYKDEYEVARLYTDGDFLRQIGEQFEGDWSLRFHLAPPLFSKRDAQGHLIKKPFSSRMLPVFRLLARMKFLRGTFFDPFGRTLERRTERALIADYMRTIRGVLAQLSNATLESAIALAGVPEEIRGYGHIKDAAIERAAILTQRFLGEFESAAQQPQVGRAA